MLARPFRVKKADFLNIIKNGQAVHSDHFYAHFIHRPVAEPSLFAFVVSNKVSKTAVGRHRIKRQMSSVVEENILKIKASWSIIILAKKGAATLPSLKIKQEISFLLNKITGVE